MTANADAPRQEPPKPAVEVRDGKASEVGVAAPVTGTSEPPVAPRAKETAPPADPATTPNEVKPNEAKPNGAKPNGAKPGEAKPDAAKPNEAKPNEAKPNAAKPNEAKLNGPLRTLWLRLRYPALALVVVAAVATTLWFTTLRPPLRSVAQVKLGDVTAEIEGTGTVTADVLANVSSKITGRVEQVFVNEGDIVQKDQLLATLDTSSLKWGVETTRARLSSAVASAKVRQSEWKTEKALAASGAVSVEEARQYEERRAVATSAVRVAASEVGNAEYELSVAQIHSLSSGIVTKRWVVPGASVVPGQPMFTVADTRLIYVNASIDQSSSGKIRKGDAATVILRGREDHPLPGYVLRINPRADQATEEMVAEVAFELPMADFQLGQWANVYVQVGQANQTPMLPRAALMPMSNKQYVFVVEKNDKTRREEVSIVADSPRAPMVAIAGNVRAGDRVVVMPMGLRPGQAIRPLPMTEMPSADMKSGAAPMGPMK